LSYYVVRLHSGCLAIARGVPPFHTSFCIVRNFSITIGCRWPLPARSLLGRSTRLWVHAGLRSKRVPSPRTGCEFYTPKIEGSVLNGKAEQEEVAPLPGKSNLI
jgi:hypothetical protein